MGLFLARLAHSLGDMAHLFDPAFDVGFSHNEVIEITVQCLTDKVEIIQIHTLRKIMVQLVDGLTANPCYASEFALCHPPFAKAGDSKILIIAFGLLCR